MPPLPANPFNSVPAAASAPIYHRAKSASDIECEEARVIFDKTIAGNYRHGGTGYRNVGALFLTWADDDMKCESLEVVNLVKIFRDKFHFNTQSFQIPSERWETALHKRVADFCYDYDSPEDLAIIYYAGHAQEDEETKQFKFAAKFSNADGLGDPTAFFPDIRTCLQLPSCDQLMILDCCYAAKAFTRDDVGKRKFELLTSSAHDLQSPAPYLKTSFTRTLCEALERLIEKNPKGFDTSHLYREVYHSMPAMTKHGQPIPKPLLFDQARHSLGRIWLRPQVMPETPPKSIGQRGYLKLTFRLNQRPDLAVMNELASHLTFLPHVDQIKYEDLRAPEEHIAKFIRLVVLASKLKPLVQKLRLRRQGRMAIQSLKRNQEANSTSLVGLHVGLNRQPNCDWSGSLRDHNHIPSNTASSRHQRKKSGTWPSNSNIPLANGSLFNGQSPNGYRVDPSTLGNSMAESIRNRMDTSEKPSSEHLQGSQTFRDIDETAGQSHQKRQRTVSLS